MAGLLVPHASRAAGAGRSPAPRRPHPARALLRNAVLPEGGRRVLASGARASKARRGAREAPVTSSRARSSSPLPRSAPPQRCLRGAGFTYASALCLLAVAGLGAVLVLAAPLDDCAGCSVPSWKRLMALIPVSAATLCLLLCCVTNMCGLRHDQFARYTTPYIESITTGLAHVTKAHTPQPTEQARRPGSSPPATGPATASADGVAAV